MANTNIYLQRFLYIYFQYWSRLLQIFKSSPCLKKLKKEVISKACDNLHLSFKMLEITGLRQIQNFLREHAPDPLRIAVPLWRTFIRTPLH